MQATHTIVSHLCPFVRGKGRANLFLGFLGMVIARSLLPLFILAEWIVPTDIFGGLVEGPPDVRTAALAQREAPGIGREPAVLLACASAVEDGMRGHRSYDVESIIRCKMQESPCHLFRGKWCSQKNVPPFSLIAEENIRTWIGRRVSRCFLRVKLQGIAKDSILEGGHLVLMNFTLCDNRILTRGAAKHWNYLVALATLIFCHGKGSRLSRRVACITSMTREAYEFGG